MQSRIRRRLAIVAGAVAVATGLAACGGSTSASGTGGSTAASVGTNLTVAWGSDVSSMDPLQPLTLQNRELAVNVYEPLVQYATTTGVDGIKQWSSTNLAPAVATDWKINGAAVTFTIRSGMKFYPSGNPVTADDVAWTFKRALEDTGGFGAFNLNLAGLFTADQIKVVDASHVTFTFEAVKGGKPTLLPVGLATLRYPQLGIMDSKTVQTHATAADPWADKWLKDNTAGTGPYYVASHTSGEQLVLKTVPGYWGPAPHFSTVTLRNVGNADVTALVKGGSVQYAATGISSNNLTDLKSSGYNVITEPVPNQMRLQLQSDTGPLKDVRIRQAIAYAIPYNQILQTAFSGRNVRAFSWDNPGAPDYDPAWNIYNTDLTKAKALMQQAGVSSLSVPLYYDSGVSYNQDVALIVQSGLAQIGIKVTLNAQPTAQFAADLNTQSEGKPSSQSGMSFYTDDWWLDNAGPSTDIWIKTGGVGNWSHYSNAQVDAIHAANYTSAGPDRDANYKKLQQLVAADAPIIPLVVTGRNLVTAKGITGDFVTPDALARYWSLTAS